MTKKYYKHGDTHRRVKGRKQKYCTKCRKWKSEREFGIDRAKRDGLNIRCRDCYRAYTRALHKKYRKGKKARIYLRFEDRHRIFRGVRQKLCSSCNKWKDESHYSGHRRLKDGLSLRCKDCGKKDASKRLERKNKGARRNLRYEDRHRIVKGVKQKRCSKCGKWKGLGKFYKNRSRKDGLMERCMKCTYNADDRSNDPKRKRTRKNLRYEDRHRVVKGVKQKYCRKCKSWKSESAFYNDRWRKDGLDNRCKNCTYIPTKMSRKR